MDKMRILELVKEAIGCLENTPQFQVKGGNIVIYNYATESIGQEIGLGNELAKLQSSMAHKVLSESLTALRTHPNLTADVFLIDIKNRLAQIKSIKKEHYKFIFPINVLEASDYSRSLSFLVPLSPFLPSNWIYHYDCYGSGEGVRGIIFKTLGEAVGGDERAVKVLQGKYEDIEHTNNYWFKKALERYFMGGMLDVNYWDGGYLFASSKEHRIKTLEQLENIMEEEDKHFRSCLDEFIGWFKSNGLNLGVEAEESLRKRMREFYNAYICNKIKEWCQLLIEEDEVDPSDVYLWWGGEPNSNSCYAFLTLFFEVDPDDIGTSRFDERVSKGLMTLINIAENDNIALSRNREYEPSVWKAVFT